MGRPVKSASYPHTPDGRYFVVRGWLWRATNPRLAKIERAELTRRLMAARRALQSAENDDRPGIRGTIDRAKRRLGERGPAWWGDARRTTTGILLRTPRTQLGTCVSRRRQELDLRKPVEGLALLR
jgi:hypothetical protein